MISIAQDTLAAALFPEPSTPSAHRNDDDDAGDVSNPFENTKVCIQGELGFDCEQKTLRTPVVLQMRPNPQSPQAAFVPSPKQAFAPSTPAASQQVQSGEYSILSALRV